MDSNRAQLLRETALIIWDEALMQYRHLYEAVNRTLKDIMHSDKPFGGACGLWWWCSPDTACHRTGFTTSNWELQAELWTLSLATATNVIFQHIDCHHVCRSQKDLEYMILIITYWCTNTNSIIINYTGLRPLYLSWSCIDTLINWKS